MIYFVRSNILNLLTETIPLIQSMQPFYKVFHLWIALYPFHNLKTRCRWYCLSVKIWSCCSLIMKLFRCHKYRLFRTLVLSIMWNFDWQFILKFDTQHKRDCMYESTFHDESTDINLTLLIWIYWHQSYFVNLSNFYYIDGQSENLIIRNPKMTYNWYQC